LLTASNPGKQLTFQMKISLFFPLIIALFFKTAVCRAQQYYFPPVNNSFWEISSPESLGWCVDNIDTLYNFLENRNTKAFIVLKDGKIVLEKYFGTFNSDSLWYWASAGKTLTSMLVGIAREEGYLSLDSSVSKYLGTGWSSCTAEKEKLIKVRNQITMTTGLNDMVANTDCTLPECLQYLADAGTRWAYHNAPYTILDPVISNATGIDFNSYFNTRIRNKTGMDGYWFYVDYNHIFFSTARSMARYGLLLLSRGSWDGQPILADSNYFSAMTNSSQDLNLSYGYLTWLNGKSSFMLPQSQFVFPGSLCPDAPADMFSAMGKNGQIINVVPSQGLIIIRMGNAPDNQYELANYFNNLIWQHLNNVICNTHGILEEVPNGNDLQIYPNPASNMINIIPDISSVIQNVRLFDLTGQLKIQVSNTNQIDVTSLSPGNYFLVVTRNGADSHHIITIFH
jgi:CubicO group peptidase (beta-lactamase class C family)